MAVNGRETLLGPRTSPSARSYARLRPARRGSPVASRALASSVTPNVLGPGPTSSNTHPKEVPFVVAHGTDAFSRPVFAGRVRLSQIRRAASLPVLFQPRTKSIASPARTATADDARTSAKRGVTTTAVAWADEGRSFTPDRFSTSSVAWRTRGVAGGASVDTATRSVIA